MICSSQIHTQTVTSSPDKWILNLSAPGRFFPLVLVLFLLLLLLLISLSFHEIQKKKNTEMIIYRKVNHISFLLQQSSHSLGDNLTKVKTKKGNKNNGFKEEEKIFHVT